MVLESDGLNASELCSYRCERDLYTDQAELWPQAGHDANEKAVPTLNEQMDLENFCPYLRPVGDQSLPEGAVA